MLNAKALSHLLTENVHPLLYPQWLIITPAGTLIAYSTPASTTELRHQAALVSSTWRDHETRLRNSEAKGGGGVGTSSAPTSLQALTIETPAATIIARPVQQRLLLVLIAPLPEDPRFRRREWFDFDVHAEAEGDPKYPGENVEQESESESEPQPPHPNDGRGEEESTGESGYEGFGLALLRMQRAKLDKGVDMIREDLKRREFVMPEGVD